MPHKKITAKELIHRAGELFRIRGFHNTSISDIASYCGLQKASIYHHVSSKKQLMLLSIEQIHEHFKEEIFSIAYNEDKPATDRLTQFIQAIETFYVGREGGSLLGNLILEIGSEDQDLIKAAQAYFTEWTKAFAYLLQSKLDEDDALLLAEDIIAYIQGAIMMMNLYSDPKRFKRIKHTLYRMVQKRTKEHDSIGE